MKATKSRVKVKKAARPQQATHRFSLLYSGVTELTNEVEDALYEQGCDDALIGIQHGFFFLDFTREAPTFRAALTSAIADVECSGLPLELVRVEPI